MNFNIDNTSPNIANNIISGVSYDIVYNNPIYKDSSNIISFNLDNTTSNRYPPAAITSTLTATFSSNLYQNNGIYTVSSSTINANSYYCFDANDAGPEYLSSTLLYSLTSPFNYTGSITTIVNGTTIIKGEWIQLYYDKGFAATSKVPPCATGDCVGAVGEPG